MKFGLLYILSLALFSCSESDITPTPVSVQDVVLNKTETSMLEGATETLSAVVAPANAQNKAVSWSTSSAAVATVSDVGIVTAVKEGTATITATTQDGAKTAACVVTVAPIAVTGVTVDPTTAAVSVGATKQLIATVLPADATDRQLLGVRAMNPLPRSTLWAW